MFQSFSYSLHLLRLFVLNVAFFIFGGNLPYQFYVDCSWVELDSELILKCTGSEQYCAWERESELSHVKLKRAFVFSNFGFVLLSLGSK